MPQQPFLILIFYLMSFVSPTNAQQNHFKNTQKYLAQNQVVERCTWDNSNKISIDKFDKNGCKIEATEIYEGNRFLSKFVDSKWTNIHTTTRYSFKYDKNGWQIEQFNHNFNKEQQNEMYQYDAYGNIERWVTGRSFQLSQKRTVVYDSYGSVLEEQNCWSENCEEENFNTISKHHLKYNKEQLLVEDLVNYVDGMNGYLYEYVFDKNGKVANKKQYFVNSYHGLDHEIPTIKDVDNKKLHHEWAYVYNDKGLLIKEIWTEHWTGKTVVHEFTYNGLGLISETRTDNSVLISYTYNDKGLVQEELHYDLSDKKKKLLKKYRFEYGFK